MQTFINFIVDNWQFVSSAAISIISFILLLIFRRNKVNVFDPGLTNEILGYVILAENKFGNGHGKEKLNFVWSQFLERHPLFDYGQWFPIIKNQVEFILSSPEKKGLN